jgi:hypothetical protein
MALRKHPNFFVAGVPKCGTTALYKYLLSHPNIFLPQSVGGSLKQKEPHFFADDMPGIRISDSENDYLHLFSDATDRHTAVGEASVMYLFSDVALEKIGRKYPESRIIIMLRNPLEAVCSFHQELYNCHTEDLSDFSVAWDAQEGRAVGKNIPERCANPNALQYREVFRYAPQLEKLWSIFPQEQTKVVVYDDFARDTRHAYKQILEFLDVPDDGRDDFERVNRSRRNRSRLLSGLLFSPPAKVKSVAEWAKRNAGIDYTRLAIALTKLNQAPHARPTLSADLQEELKATFEPDVMQVSRLLDRDLGYWFATE